MQNAFGPQANSAKISYRSRTSSMLPSQSHREKPPLMRTTGFNGVFAIRKNVALLVRELGLRRCSENPDCEKLWIFA
jgi:hypothetical protein